MTDPPFRVVFSELIRKKVEALAERRSQQRSMGRYIDTLTAMNDGLTQSPETWGDPLFRYEQLKLKTYERCVDLLYVCYCVDSEHCTVTIKEVLPVPGGLLDL